MVQAGAEGITKSQITDLISKGASDDDTLQFYSDLMRQILDSTSNAQIRIANGFFFSWECSRNCSIGVQNVEGLSYSSALHIYSLNANLLQL
ncbi:unnamed protein product [Cylicostephanus goldi]|uniref:Uncharacterized protein n=1 Tax=Cylicostephanus goldi TaxID=71465 RepID=A0A3P7MVV9_CYLGO|nr:unnamed protein product [Cylicostephanus goldi]